MKRRTLLGGAGAAAAVGAGYLGYERFAPERATRADRDRAADGATVLKTGEFTGKDGHHCAGTVLLARDADGRFLQFRRYEQTQGPDVYCFLTPAPDPDEAAKVEAGTKVRIDGGADGGELTKTGTFAQPLPAAADPGAARGVAAWCEDFSVPFGAATLTEP